jgi:4-aminobutyrate aminotransferase / (S)-3-amino-2-methylpropionate transaminase / 5-aminovalerate transaminase
MTTHDAHERDLAGLRAAYVPAAYLQHHPIFAGTGRGSVLTDTDGRSYLDFTGGIAVLNIGHRHPRVVESVRAQLDELMHSGPVLLHPRYVELAAEIAMRAPGSADKQVLFVNSGAEAVENAVKVARHASGRPGIIAFDRSFHGRTLLTSTLTGKVHPFKTQPGAMAPHVYHAPYPYPYRPPVGVAGEDVVSHAMGALDDLLHHRLQAADVAAVLVEPVQGEGGYIVPPAGFLNTLSAWCVDHDVLLIVDEIQTGYGRTGLMFACEHEGVEPDILVLGKSIADGLPLAAVVAKRSIFESVPNGDLGGTYGGNPLSCAAGLAVLEVFDREDLLVRAAEIGRVSNQMLHALDPLEHIGEVRGLGPMLAVEFVDDKASRRPAAEIAARVVTAARVAGLLVIRAGIFDNVVRVVPPLNVSEQDLERGLEFFANACRN